MRKPAVDIAISAEYDPAGSLRCALGLMLFRCWLYKKAMPMLAYQLDSDIAFGKAQAYEREGGTYYYR